MGKAIVCPYRGRVVNSANWGVGSEDVHASRHLGCYVGAISNAHSQDFYKGKTIRVVVGHNVGNDYDVGTRLLTKHLSKYIPGHPTIVLQNMPQAAGIAAANFLRGRHRATAW